MPEIYEPQEDSYLFKEFLETTFTQKDKHKTFLDMGTGSGILAKTVNTIGIPKTNITTADINRNAVEQSKRQGYNAIHTNLFQNIKQKFDIILFNAPYLPRDQNEPQDSQTITTGGKNGDEITIEFIKQAKKHLNPNGTIYLLISSLTPKTNINKYKPQIVRSKQLPFFEKIHILKIQYP